MTQTHTKNSSQAELEQALFYVEELMERIQTPYVLLSSTAQTVVNNGILEGEEIHVGITKTHFGPYTRQLFNIVHPDLDASEKEIVIEGHGAPIRITIIHKDFQFLKYPDVVFYNYGQYPVPNPFKKYWKAKGLVA